MDKLLENLPLVLAALFGGLVAVAAVYVVFSRLLATEEARQRAELRLKAFTTAMPLKLQAYERLILFLERIHPASLLPRSEPKGKSARLLADQLKAEIYAEFEHNVVQQLYVNENSWQRLLMARDTVLALIDTTQKQLPESATGVDLANGIFERMKGMEGEFPTTLATNAIRRELQEILDTV